MDPIAVSLLTGYLASILANYTPNAINKFTSFVLSRSPELERRVLAAKSTTDVEAIFRDAVGVIDASAGTAEIDIDRALIEALRGIRFDHAAGIVRIAGATVKAPALVTGGQAGATGKTVISGNTELKSSGTSIKLTGGASITITGNASITQT